MKRYVMLAGLPGAVLLGAFVSGYSYLKIWWKK